MTVSSYLWLGIGVDVSLQYESGRVWLEEERLLVYPGRDVLLVLGPTSEVEGQCALLLSNTIDRLDHVVTSVTRRRVLPVYSVIISFVSNSRNSRP